MDFQETALKNEAKLIVSLKVEGWILDKGREVVLIHFFSPISLHDTKRAWKSQLFKQKHALSITY